jgi:hypothetical protein
MNDPVDAIHACSLAVKIRKLQQDKKLTQLQLARGC